MHPLRIAPCDAQAAGVCGVMSIMGNGGAREKGKRGSKDGAGGTRGSEGRRRGENGEQTEGRDADGGTGVERDGRDEGGRVRTRTGRGRGAGCVVWDMAGDDEDGGTMRRELRRTVGRERKTSFPVRQLQRRARQSATPSSCAGPPQCAGKREGLGTRASEDAAARSLGDWGPWRQVRDEGRDRPRDERRRLVGSGSKIWAAGLGDVHTI
ncbi:hypothetical protein C8J57DRAFT_1212249 [Mycena rebaudengoi]|nr:hypothetical protein C8J57DRAFT_1212249 [Mycena rebaudengoi]